MPKLAFNEGPPPGTVLAGRYRVERTLGHGGIGVVVEATHLGLEQLVAIKMLRAHRGTSKDLVERLLREARIAAKLSSDHTVRVYDVDRAEDGSVFVVMERLVGRDLAHELHARRRVEPDLAVFWVLQACVALSEAHSLKLVHRDVKPANLFLARRTLARPSVIKLLDFGLSKARELSGPALTRTSGSLGTPGYMSPEQIQSAKNVDHRADQFAIAAVLYELLAGRPAYEGRNPAELAKAVLMGPPPKLRDFCPSLHPGLAVVVERGMAHDPSERYSDLPEFAADLARFGDKSHRHLVEQAKQARIDNDNIPPSSVGIPRIEYSSDDSDGNEATQAMVYRQVPDAIIRVPGSDAKTTNDGDGPTLVRKPKPVSTDDENVGTRKQRREQIVVINPPTGPARSPDELAETKTDVIEAPTARSNAHWAFLLAAVFVAGVVGGFAVWWVAY